MYFAGDIAQVAIVNGRGIKGNTVTIGPAGKFATMTACPRVYMQEKSEISYMTEAEVFAGIDGKVINIFII